jgi:tRNA pseudouridine55 synthase
VGHTGTLDPFASGLLLLCVGWATRIAEYLSGLPKSYRAVAHLGVETDSADRMGAVVGASDGWRELGHGEIEAAFQAQVGTILQLPPAFSAKRIGGERAYDLARRGEAVELEPVRVTIERLEIVDIALPEVTFEVECSSGTYVRSIARDVGAILGVGGHLTALRRTRVGCHDVSGAIPPSRLDDPDAVREAWLSPAAALRHLAHVEVGGEEFAALTHGRAIPAGDRAPEGAPVALTCQGHLVAIGEIEHALLRPRKVFPRD